MKEAGDRAASLVRQLLTFARKQQAQLPSAVNLNDIVADMEQAIRRLVGADTAVVLRLRSDIGQVRVDSRQIEQVITNLVINSRDAMPRGGTLTIETGTKVVEGHTLETPDVPQGNYTLLAVTDTGIGIDVATKPHIFEPFFTTKPMGEGAGGLGLPTVYGIVKQSGGGIHVSSEPGKGTVVEIYFPEVESADTHAASAASSALEWRSETILLVEDNDRVRELLRSILQRDGYTVLEAGDGAEALRLYESHPQIDLLLADAVMPHLSGRALAKHLIASHSGLRVLFMSGYTEEHILRRGFPAARAPFIQKPFRARELTHAVRQALDAATPSSVEA
jgi:CheY-like chemotaxis protein